ncbi:MAG: thymidine phosphorylase [Gammaproteobacteria bacterium]|nr:MAG: thymidine phosphorylase [Gammaproteobacteria bacterium]
MALPEELIRAKRDGLALTEDRLQDFVNGVASGQVSDAQIGAFTMAVYCQGMSMAEQSAFTLAMRDTGRCLSWPDLNGPVLDKHSTGGVGDLVSLVLAPMLAACGAYIPMISGRGLGHTGGTLDKLESIPGFNVNPSRQRFSQTVRKTGLAMIGQSTDLAPADGRIYAVRNVTATVDSVPLIVASILSKKLAEGLDGLVLDIKTGNGAFMTERNRSRDLAANLVEVAELAGLPCRALITDMNQPLARSAGNALEIHEAIKFLRADRRPARLEQVVLSLSIELMLLGGLADKAKTARRELVSVLENGKAAEHFARMVVMQGGPADLLDQPAKHLPAAPVIRALESPTSGYIEYVDTRAIGQCVVQLGGGRRHLEDRIDHRVGLSELCSVGDPVNKGDPLGIIHAADETAWQAAAKTLTAAITVGRKTDTLPAVYERY